MGSFSVKPYQKIQSKQDNKIIEEIKPIFNDNTIHSGSPEALKRKEIRGSNSQFKSILHVPDNFVEECYNWVDPSDDLEPKFHQNLNRLIKDLNMATADSNLLVVDVFEKLAKSWILFRAWYDRNRDIGGKVFAKDDNNILMSEILNALRKVFTIIQQHFIDGHFQGIYMKESLVSLLHYLVSYTLRVFIKINFMSSVYFHESGAFSLICRCIRLSSERVIAKYSTGKLEFLQPTKDSPREHLYLLPTILNNCTIFWNISWPVWAREQVCSSNILTIMVSFLTIGSKINNMKFYLFPEAECRRKIYEKEMFQEAMIFPDWIDEYKDLIEYLPEGSITRDIACGIQNLSLSDDLRNYILQSGLIEYLEKPEGLLHMLRESGSSLKKEVYVELAMTMANAGGENYIASFSLASVVVNSTFSMATELLSSDESCTDDTEISIRIVKQSFSEDCVKVMLELDFIAIIENLLIQYTLKSDIPDNTLRLLTASWNIGFVAEGKEALKKSTLFELIRSIAKSNDGQHPVKVKQKAEGLLFSLGESTEKMAQLAEELLEQNNGNQIEAPFIMFSYSWKHQARTLNIVRALQHLEYNVWVDKDQMKGSTLEAMALAVEKADIILVCMSSAYKESTNCRTEAEYAFSQHKKILPLMMEKNYNPTGWLGAMIGSKLWYDFSCAYPSIEFQEMIESLCKDLGNTCKKQSASPNTRQGNNNQNDSLRFSSNSNNDNKAMICKVLPVGETSYMKFRINDEKYVDFERKLLLLRSTMIDKERLQVKYKDPEGDQCSLFDDNSLDCWKADGCPALSIQFP